MWLYGEINMSCVYGYFYLPSLLREATLSTYVKLGQKYNRPVAEIENQYLKS